METRKGLSGLVSIVLALCVAFVAMACTSAESTGTRNGEIAAAVEGETININIASPGELQRIPFIGERLAAEIVEHRERYGQFRRPEDLLLLNGISDKRFREIRHLLRVD